jgi:DNA repair exonuclease SbcCD ATPase subunit
MKNCFLAFFIGVISLALYSCVRKTNKDRAIALVESKYENSRQDLNFNEAKLDSLYNISPQAYADSVKKGDELDVALAELESQIEHLGQAESDSVGLISAKLSKERYRLLDLKKIKPQFIGWKLSGVAIVGNKQKKLSFNFDKGITKIVP